ncbi:MAG: methyltransferase domain-containing protein [Candidatus Electrothrix communis]|nr:MAG: methyltransferase domain-containing protein [Candidatus Electrothrix communis]
MNETSKTKLVWSETEKSYLTGKGIDIGCGSDPLNEHVFRFDIDDGDANNIGLHVQGEFDFVYSSHCLEHLSNPWEAIHEWWNLVKPGGFLFFLVPDEDLYEQGVFPSRFNSDHKWTFTISKEKSWSPVSINILNLVRTLQEGEIVSLKQQDIGYDYNLYKLGSLPKLNAFGRLTLKLYRALRRRGMMAIFLFEEAACRYQVVDQTVGHALAQIQCVIRKRSV